MRCADMIVTTVTTAIIMSAEEISPKKSHMCLAIPAAEMTVTTRCVVFSPQDQNNPLNQKDQDSKP